jgi:hypothetical protein
LEPRQKTVLEFINAANIQGWYDDILDFLQRFLAPPIPFLTTKSLSTSYLIEQNVLRWLKRPNVRDCVEDVANELLHERILSSEVVIGLCSEIAPEERITLQSLTAEISSSEP